MAPRAAFVGLALVLPLWSVSAALAPPAEDVRLFLGRDLGEVAVDAERGRVYVGNRTLLAVLDLEGSLLAQVPVPGAPNAVALDPSTGLVYVALHAASQVAAVDPVAGAVLWTAPVGARPRDVALHPSGLLYTANEEGSVSVVDTRTRQALRTQPLAAGSAWAVEVDPVTHLVFVVTVAGVRVLDPAGLVEAQLVPRGSAYALAVEPVLRMLYVAGSEGVTVTDLVTGAELVHYAHGASTPIAAEPGTSRMHYGVLDFCWLTGELWSVDWVLGRAASSRRSECPRAIAVDGVHDRIYTTADSWLTIAPIPAL